MVGEPHDTLAYHVTSGSCLELTMGTQKVARITCGHGGLSITPDEVTEIFYWRMVAPETLDVLIAFKGWPQGTTLEWITPTSDKVTPDPEEGA